MHAKRLNNSQTRSDSNPANLNTDMQTANPAVIPSNNGSPIRLFRVLDMESMIYSCQRNSSLRGNQLCRFTVA
jgi:hypothetical protein